MNAENSIEWFVNKNIILGIPGGDISSEAQELIQDSINFLDEFIGLSNQTIIAPFIGILVLIITAAPDLRGVSEEWETMFDKYEKSISERLDLVNNKLFADFLSALMGKMNK